jgi:hypothetical protein
MFKGQRNEKGRPKGSLNRITSDVKEVIQSKAFELLDSIEIEKLSETNKVKMLSSLLPYILSKTNIQINDVEQPIFRVEVIEN